MPPPCQRIHREGWEKAASGLGTPSFTLAAAPSSSEGAWDATASPPAQCHVLEDRRPHSRTAVGQDGRPHTPTAVATGLRARRAPAADSQSLAEGRAAARTAGVPGLQRKPVTVLYVSVSTHTTDTPCNGALWYELSSLGRERGRLFTTHQNHPPPDYHPSHPNPHPHPIPPPPSPLRASPPAPSPLPATAGAAALPSPSRPPWRSTAAAAFAASTVAAAAAAIAARGAPASPSKKNATQSVGFSATPTYQYDDGGGGGGGGGGGCGDTIATTGDADHVADGAASDAGYPPASAPAEPRTMSARTPAAAGSTPPFPTPPRPLQL